MVERCYRCDRSDEEVKLLDVVYGNEIVKMCEECVVVEDVVVLRRPTTYQLKVSKEGGSVYERLRRLSGIEEKEKKDKEKIEKILFGKDKEKKDIFKELEKARERNVPLKLVDNFHWLIVISRRRKKLSRKQVADAIGESEEVIEMVEKGILPDDANVVIGKLEQFFDIKLKKEYGEEKNDEKISKDEMKEEKPSVILKIDRDTINKLTIADLIEMKKMKEKIEGEEANEKEVKEEIKKKEPSDEEIRELIWRYKKEEDVKKSVDEGDENKKVEIKKENGESANVFKEFLRNLVNKIKEKFKRRKKLTQEEIEKILSDEKNLIRRKNEF